MTLHLSIVLWLPIAFGVLGLFAPPKLAGRVALAGATLVLSYAVLYVADFDMASGGLQYVTDETWIAELGIHYKLGLDGLNIVFVLLTAIMWFAATLWANFSDFEKPRLFFFHRGSRPRCGRTSATSRSPGCSSFIC